MARLLDLTEPEFPGVRFGANVLNIYTCHASDMVCEGRWCWAAGGKQPPKSQSLEYRTTSGINFDIQNFGPTLIMVRLKMSLRVT